MTIYNKDDIEFVTEFPCLLGHPVLSIPPNCLFKETVNTISSDPPVIEWHVRFITTPLKPGSIKT